MTNQKKIRKLWMEADLNEDDIELLSKIKHMEE